MRGCWAQAKELALTYLVVMVVGTVSSSAAIALHLNAPQWEAPATFISLGLGLALAAWWLRTKRKVWPAGMPSALLLLFSFGSALLHGWQVPTEAVAFSGAGAFIAFWFFHYFRWRSRYESAMRLLGEELHGDPHLRGGVLFRDDGERIIAYPKRGSLLVQIVIEVCLLALTGGILLSGLGSALEHVTTGNIVVLTIFGYCACLTLVVFLFTLYRLLLRRPTLIVGPDGIIDHGSLIGTGVGLLQWVEILDVDTFTKSGRRVGPRYLSILVEDIRAIRRRQPTWKRWAMRVFGRLPSGLLVWQGLLNIPVGELVTQIERYIKTHAPPGWLDDEEGDDEGGEAAPIPTQ